MDANTDRELMTTGQAARLLGSSRQHVVDLCDRGEVTCRRTPVHRRLLRSDVEALARTRRGLTREELRSLWLNRAVAAHLARDPERVLERARRNLARFSEIHARGSAEPWLKRWQTVLDQGPEAVMETLTSTAPEAAELRQNSPFPGVLPEKERRQVLESFGKYWTRMRT
jgi:excisionase family DNA binding protein